MLPNACTFACTATCSTTSLPRLLQRLHLPLEPQIHRFSANLSNCFLRVVPSKDKASDLRYMFEQIDGVQKPATLEFVESKKEAGRVSLGLKALITASSTLSEHEILQFNSYISAAEKKSFKDSLMTSFAASSAHRHSAPVLICQACDWSSIIACAQKLQRISKTLAEVDATASNTSASLCFGIK